MAKKSRSGRTPRTTSQEPERPEIRDETWRRLIFQTFGHQRFTQDSPVLPDVWLKYAKANPDVRIDLILTPRSGHAPGTIAVALTDRLKDYHAGKMTEEQIRQAAVVAYNRSTVVAKLTFMELLRVVVPMTSWWRSLPEDYRSLETVEDRLADLKHERVDFKKLVNTTEKWEYFRFIVLAGFIYGWRELPDPDSTAEDLQLSSDFSRLREIAEDFLKLFRSFKRVAGGDADGEIWKISYNRPTGIAMFESRLAVKADAASNVFQISTQDLAWAVIDCGIDARHPAFLDRDPKLKHKLPKKGADISAEQSRVKQTFDFTHLRSLLASLDDKSISVGGRRITLNAKQRGEMTDLRRRIGLGREIDWGMILPLIEIPHNDKDYVRPTHEHGTHVAGILAGHWPADENEQQVNLIGVCPDLRLYDFRVFDSNGTTEEFIIMSAVQVVAHLNRFRTKPVIHGVNMSMSIRHEVMNYACGRTPICDECARLVGDGIVVVTAAGNEGFMAALEGGGQFGSYRVASITDPGNADAVITVGATHRRDPHTYGVSYFSSRGPTGDGRRKPDLVAPGEGITAPIPFCGAKPLDGTSMAAPHVSGAAALLMARHQELVGRPNMIKQILCKSATDLGREVDFQGAGMLDVLRALQSV
jgi:serine protease AprX